MANLSGEVCHVRNYCLENLLGFHKDLCPIWYPSTCTGIRKGSVRCAALPFALAAFQGRYNDVT